MKVFTIFGEMPSGMALWCTALAGVIPYGLVAFSHAVRRVSDPPWKKKLE